MLAESEGSGSDDEWLRWSAQLTAMTATAAAAAAAALPPLLLATVAARAFGAAAVLPMRELRQLGNCSLRRRAPAAVALVTAAGGGGVGKPIGEGRSRRRSPRFDGTNCLPSGRVAVAAAAARSSLCNESTTTLASAELDTPLEAVEGKTRGRCEAVAAEGSGGACCVGGSDDDCSGGA